MNSEAKKFITRARQLVVLPLPEAVDEWLDGDYFTLFKDNVHPAYFQMGDVPSDQVLCTVQLSTTKVLFLSSAFYIAC